MKILYLLIFSFFLVNHSDAQDTPEEESGNFFIGVNVGGFFANKNTSIMYTGSNIANVGIDYYFPTEFGGKAPYDYSHDEIKNYFSYNYKIEADGLPASPAYRPAIDVGIHTGVKLGGGNSIFVDINSTTLKYQQYFSISVEDPNVTPNIRYEQVPLFGEEKRLHINLGTQISFYNENDLNWYGAIFGNFNSARLQKNYFVLNNKQYQISHYKYGTNQLLPGGNGLGGGIGTGAKYKFNDQFTFDLTYNLYYTRTTMVLPLDGAEGFQPFGIHHGILLRVIFG